jgi:chloramphenicol O-acetyltransferase
MNIIVEYKARDLTQYYRIQYFDENNREIKIPKFLTVQKIQVLLMIMNFTKKLENKKKHSVSVLAETR